LLLLSLLRAFLRLGAREAKPLHPTRDSRAPHATPVRRNLPWHDERPDPVTPFDGNGRAAHAEFIDLPPARAAFQTED